MQIKRKINDLNTLEIKLFDEAYNIANNINSINPNYKIDIRYTTYTTLSSIIRSIKLLLILKDEYLDKDEWWNSNYNKHFSGLDSFSGISENGRNVAKIKNYKIIPEDLMQFILVGAISSLFSLMESRFRTFYNYFLDPNKKGDIKASGGIFDISIELLKSINYSHKQNTIKLFKNMRNTVHNNGIFTHPYDEIEYNGKLYKFETNKSPGYGDVLDLLIKEILPDIVEIFDKVISRLLNENIIIDFFAKSSLEL